MLVLHAITNYKIKTVFDKHMQSHSHTPTHKQTNYLGCQEKSLVTEFTHTSHLRNCYNNSWNLLI